MAQAGVAREDVNYINAHASSTPLDDLKEFEAIIRCFGQNTEVIILSTNSIKRLALSFLERIVFVSAANELYKIYGWSSTWGCWCCGSCCNC